MDFSSMNGPQLVAAWNEMVLTAIDLGLKAQQPVKKFTDVKTGRERCETLHGLISMFRNQSGPKSDQPVASSEGIPDFLKRTKPPQETLLSAAMKGKISTAEALSRIPPMPPSVHRDFRIPKGMSDEEGQAMLARQAQEKKDKTVARVELMKSKLAEKNNLKLKEINTKREEKGLAPLASLEDKSPIVKQEKVMAAKKVKSKSNGASKGKWMSNDATITKLAKDNPKRKGTRGYQLWEKYKNGMTIGAWKEAGKQYAMPYLRWDIAHGLIKVS